MTIEQSWRDLEGPWLAAGERSPTARREAQWFFYAGVATALQFGLRISAQGASDEDGARQMLKLFEEWRLFEATHPSPLWRL